MAINKVIYGQNTIIDITDTTAVATDVASGKYFYLANGQKVSGTASGGASSGDVWQDEYGLVHLSDEPGTNVLVTPLSITSNGTYTASSGTAYSPVTVNVAGGVTYTATFTGTQGGRGPDSPLGGKAYVTHNNVSYAYAEGHSFEYSAGDELYCYVNGTDADVFVIQNGIETNHGSEYTYTLPDYDISIELCYGSEGYVRITADPPAISITTNGSYNVKSYYTANVNVPVNGITADDIAMRTISGAIGGNATKIESYAFSGCSSLTQANFPSCTSIGSYAFYYCTSLSQISFPVCMSIGPLAFYRCSSLSQISFPVCTSIPDDAFFSCTSLTRADFPVCTSIGTYAFYYCSSLSQISFPVCTSIGASAFYYCSSLSQADFPVCKSIGACAFSGCISLTQANFPSCTSIGSSAFYYCTSLSQISFPVCKSIGITAFRICSSLSQADFPVCTLIGSSAFYSCTSLSQISFPVCTSIAQGAFSGCISLTQANFPSCKSIGASAFRNCISLSQISFPVCTSIGTYAFYSCCWLTTAIFSTTSATNTIYTQCFVNCSRLISLYLLGSSLYVLSSTTASTFLYTPILGSTTYTDGVLGSVFVPMSLYDAYISDAKWSDMAIRFVSLTDAEVNNVLMYGRHDP